MKKLFLLGVFLLAGLGWYSQVPEDTQAATIITAPDPMSVACAAGYTRMAPHFCQKTSALVGQASTIDTTCHSIDWVATDGIPSTATSALILYRQFLVSNNAIANRRLDTGWFLDVGCTQPLNSRQTVIREFAAVVAGTEIARLDTESVIKLISSGKMYYIAQRVDGAAHTSTFILLGYYD